MKTETARERGAPRSPPWRMSHVPVGVFTAELGRTGVPPAPAAAIAFLVALATAWTAAERTPASTVLPESSARSASADEEARTRYPEASSSTTPGASGRPEAASQASATSPRRTARANSAEASARSATSSSSNSGWPARRSRITDPQVAPSATNTPRSSGPMPTGVSRSRKRGLRSGSPLVASLIVAALRLARASWLNLLTSLTAYSLFARVGKRSGRPWRRCWVIRSEPGSSVCQQAASNGRVLFNRAAASSKNSARVGARRARHSRSSRRRSGAHVPPIALLVAISRGSQPLHPGYTPKNWGLPTPCGRHTLALRAQPPGLGDARDMKRGSDEGPHQQQPDPDPRDRGARDLRGRADLERQRARQADRRPGAAGGRRQLRPRATHPLQRSSSRALRLRREGPNRRRRLSRAAERAREP